MPPPPPLNPTHLNLFHLLFLLQCLRLHLLLLFLLLIFLLFLSFLLLPLSKKFFRLKVKYHTYSISIFYLFCISKLIGSNPDAFFCQSFHTFCFLTPYIISFFMAFKRQLNILPYNHRISILSFSKKLKTDRPTGREHHV